MCSQLWEYVTFLIKDGADVNYTNEDDEGQQTILHDVQRTGQPVTSYSAEATHHAEGRKSASVGRMRRAP